MNDPDLTHDAQPVPEWFGRALEARRTDGWAESDGCRIHYATWGDASRPGLVLLHGSNAHLEWWRFVAPFLSDQFYVVAIDLSGNGDSGWRERYTGAAFAAEVMAVCEAAGVGPRPYIVAHSFGGFVALEAGYRYGAALGGVIFGDFTVAPPEEFVEWGRKAETHGPSRPTRVYPTLAAALGRFRLLPDQPTRYPPVLDYIARQSLREVEGGWTWKFDPSLFDHLEMGTDQRDRFLDIPCRTAVILGERSEDEGAQSGDYLREISAGLLPVFHLPTTFHHFMFDEPIAVVAAIKGILLAWRQQDHADELQAAFARVQRSQGAQSGD